MLSFSKQKFCCCRQSSGDKKLQQKVMFSQNSFLCLIQPLIVMKSLRSQLKNQSPVKFFQTYGQYISLFRIIDWTDLSKQSYLIIRIKIEMPYATKENIQTISQINAQSSPEQIAYVEELVNNIKAQIEGIDNLRRLRRIYQFLLPLQIDDSVYLRNLEEALQQQMKNHPDYIDNKKDELKMHKDQLSYYRWLKFFFILAYLMIVASSVVLMSFNKTSRQFSKTFLPRNITIGMEQKEIYSQNNTLSSIVIKETSFEFNILNVFVLVGAIIILLVIWIGVFGISIQLNIQNIFLTWKEIKIQGYANKKIGSLENKINEIEMDLMFQIRKIQKNE